MQGRPVWLVSVSLRRRSRIVATGDWSAEERRQADRLIERALEGLGDPSIERQFRMNVTLCRHRALAAAEIDALPASWQTDRVWHVAGSPVEILWTRGVVESVSAQPCRAPAHRLVDVARPDLWIPDDCGQCEPCVARAAAIEGGAQP